MLTADAAIRERIADTRRTLKHAEKLRKRATAVAEIRGHVRVTLLALMRYEPRYGELLTAMEDEWGTY